jgi:hypothetical protein
MVAALKIPVSDPHWKSRKKTGAPDLTEANLVLGGSEHLRNQGEKVLPTDLLQSPNQIILILEKTSRRYLV